MGIPVGVRAGGDEAGPSRRRTGAAPSGASDVYKEQKAVSPKLLVEQKLKKLNEF